MLFLTAIGGEHYLKKDHGILKPAVVYDILILVLIIQKWAERGIRPRV